MDVPAAVRMDADERDAFLGTSGTGIIALSESMDTAPHAVPVSYGYDPEASDFYFRLAVGRGSEKGNLQDRAATFVTFGDVEGTWKSVVAKGNLRSTTDESIETEALAGLDRVQIPLVDIFGRSLDDVSFEFYQLRPAELTGRVEHYPV